MSRRIRRPCVVAVIAPFSITAMVAVCGPWELGEFPVVAGNSSARSCDEGSSKPSASGFLREILESKGKNVNDVDLEKLHDEMEKLFRQRRNEEFEEDLLPYKRVKEEGWGGEMIAYLEPHSVGVDAFATTVSLSHYPLRVHVVAVIDGIEPEEYRKRLRQALLKEEEAGRAPRRLFLHNQWGDKLLVLASPAME